MKAVRSVLGHKLFIHGMVLLGFAALWGYIETMNTYLFLGVAASFLGAICGSFIRVTDKIENIK